MTELLEMKAVGPNICTLVSGGEAVKNSLVSRVYAETNIRRVINAYGPTEYTTYATARELENESAEEPPIGWPVTNSAVYLVDRALRPALFGARGEICIGGRGLARGYLHRPEITAERFIPDGFSGEPGARLFRTGDLGQELANGELVYWGRIDDQLKLRGFRIEPGEIEAALVALPEISQAVVVARDDQRGEKVLVAYVVPAAALELDVQELRQQLAQRLPAYMVPASLVSLDALPLTSNGKLDRRALPQPEFTSALWRAPRTPEEEILCSLFAEVLALPQVGVDDDSSRSAAIPCSLPDSPVSCAPPSTSNSPFASSSSLPLWPNSLPVCATQLRAVRRRCGHNSGLHGCRSPTPSRGLAIDQLGGSSSEYNMPLALHLRGELQTELLHDAVNLLVARHESLRTHFAEHDGEPVQVILPELFIELPVEDSARLMKARGKRGSMRVWRTRPISPSTSAKDRCCDSVCSN